MESKIPQLKMEPRVLSPSLSATSKGEQLPTVNFEEIFKVKESTDEGKAVSAPLKSSEKGRMGKVPDASEATHDSISVKEPASQGSAPLADEDVQQRPVSGEAGNASRLIFRILLFVSFCCGLLVGVFFLVCYKLISVFKLLRVSVQYILSGGLRNNFFVGD